GTGGTSLATASAEAHRAHRARRSPGGTRAPATSTRPAIPRRQLRARRCYARHATACPRTARAGPPRTAQDQHGDGAAAQPRRTWPQYAAPGDNTRHTPQGYTTTHNAV